MYITHFCYYMLSNKFYTNISFLLVIKLIKILDNVCDILDDDIIYKCITQDKCLNGAKMRFKKIHEYKKIYITWECARKKIL